MSVHVKLNYMINDFGLKKIHKCMGEKRILITENLEIVLW